MPRVYFLENTDIGMEEGEKKKRRQCEKQRKEEYILKRFLPVRGKIWAKRRWDKYGQ